MVLYAKSFSSSLPHELKVYIAEQSSKDYTNEDKKNWSYLFNNCHKRLKKHAHPMILEGIQYFNLSASQIPSISEISQRLQIYGWQAVPIEGFLPPYIFFLFHKYKILPIEKRIRKEKYLNFSPFPDLFHEIIGHCPLITINSFRELLFRFGLIASQLTISKGEETFFKELANNYSIGSEGKAKTHSIRSTPTLGAFERLSRLYWWSIENGLLKYNDSYKVVGANLLSSKSEIQSSISKETKKQKFDLECTEIDYQLGEEQNMLFFAENIEEYINTLDIFAKIYLKKRISLL